MGHITPVLPPHQSRQPGAVAIPSALTDAITSFSRLVEGLGAWAPIVFVLGYVIAAVALVPASLLTLSAGAIFGPVRGVIFVFAGATLGACAAFLVARHAARGAVQRRLLGHPKFAAVDAAIEGQGWWVVVLLRLSPLFPYTLLNYALGLTRVRFRDYALASIGMLPGTIAYVYYGSVAGDAARAAAGLTPAAGTTIWVLRIVGVVAAIVVTALITRAARRALREATDAAA